MLSLEEIVETMGCLNEVPQEYGDRLVEQSLSAEALVLIDRQLCKSIRGWSLPKGFFRWGHRKNDSHRKVVIGMTKELAHVHLSYLNEDYAHCQGCINFRKLLLCEKQQIPEQDMQRIFGTYIEQLDKKNMYYINRTKELAPYELLYELLFKKEEITKNREDVRWIWGLIRGKRSGLTTIITNKDLPMCCMYCLIGMTNLPEHIHNDAKKDFEYIKRLIDSQKELGSELEAARVMYRNEARNNAQLQKRVEEAEKVYKRVSDELSLLKAEFQAKPATPEKEWQKQPENDVTKLQERVAYLQEQNEVSAQEKSALVKKVEALALQNSKQRAVLEKYEGKAKGSEKQGIDTQKRELLSLYQDKKVVVFGGHPNQFRTIRDILEPVGAEVEHYGIEHDGDWKRKRIPQSADLGIIYTGNMTHKAEWTIRKNASHLNLVRFSGSKATLPDFLAEQAEEYFSPKPSSSPKPL